MSKVHTTIRKMADMARKNSVTLHVDASIAITIDWANLLVTVDGMLMITKPIQIEELTENQRAVESILSAIDGLGGDTVRKICACINTDAMNAFDDDVEDMYDQMLNALHQL